MKWINPTIEKPEPRKIIIILTDNGRVHVGYMNKSKWPDGEDMISFHGEYYDRIMSGHGKYVYALVNCLAWMPMPNMPEITRQFNTANERLKKELQET